MQIETIWVVYLAFHYMQLKRCFVFGKMGNTLLAEGCEMLVMLGKMSVTRVGEFSGEKNCK